MTNGEKLKEIFPSVEVVAIVPHEVVVTKKLDDDAPYTRTSFRYEWWNAEYEEPTTRNDLGVDCISREQALNEFCIYNSYDSIGVDKVRSYLKALPSLTPQPCEDAISRQALLNATVNKNSIWNKITDSKGENLEAIISKLPSVTLQPIKNDLGVDSLFAEFKEKLSKWLFHNSESVCGNNMIDIDYLEGHIDEILYEMGIIGEEE